MANDIQKMTSYKSQIEKIGIPISSEEYHELSAYAKLNNIILSGFKDYVGNINTIKQIIDDIIIIAADFPLLISDKHGITLELDYNMGTDFATTVSNHIIHLNAVYYSNLEVLITDYNDGVSDGRFVKNTDWHSVIMHEAGHVVANLYHLNPMTIAMKILNTQSKLKVLDVLTDILSIYSTEYEDGREIISESFSGFYGKANNEFANAYVTECKRIIQEGGD